MKKVLTLKALYTLAVNMLARREHSTLELKEKLKTKTDHPEFITQVIQLLTEKNLLSDRRFAESYWRMRTQRGYGKLRIQAELKKKGIEENLCSENIREEEMIRKVRTKKFGHLLPATIKEKAKQARYLQYKGFSFEAIKKVLHHDNDE